MTKKISQPITPQELLKGLKELENEGAHLPESPESLLNKVVVNTSKSYMGKKSRLKTQPQNAKDAKTEANSKVLRKNMEDVKRFGPPDTDAHHIVPGADNRPWAKQYAEAARAILRRWGIPINHEANGVYLPSSSDASVESLPDAISHKKTHTKVYYINISEHLADAKGRQQCLDMLREIGEDLEDGVYPV